MSHNSSQKSSQSQPSSQQTVSSDPSSQQTLSETSSRNSSQSSQPQVTFQQRTQRPTNNSPRRTNSRQRGFQPRTRGRPITRTYRGYPYSLTVDLPPREDVSSQKQPQLDLPLREKIFPRNSCNSTSPFARRYFLAKTTATRPPLAETTATRPPPFARHSFLATVATCPPLATFAEKVSGTKVVCCRC